MTFQAMNRRRAFRNAALTLTLVPLVLGTSSLSVLVAPGGDQPARGDGQDDSRASRATVRETMLSEVDPELILAGSGDRPSGNDKVVVSSPKGTRVWTASSMTDSGIPDAALAAYRNAAAMTAVTDPACQLPWTLLAGIGRVESDHGRYGGATLGDDGVSRPLIIGVALNGVGPVAAIPDTDSGRFDHDSVWDRAVGPMQFIPSTWAFAARDGDGDGVATPNDIDDAALAAAGYLCAGAGSMRDETYMRAAIFRYNPDDYYVALVMALERGYRSGVIVLPSPPGSDDGRSGRKAGGDARHGKADTKDGTGGAGADGSGGRTPTTEPRPSSAPSSSSPPSSSTGSPSPSPTGSSSASPTGSPSPSPTGSPSPSPTGSMSSGPSADPPDGQSPSPSPDPGSSGEPEPVTLTAVFRECGDADYCLGDLLLDLGPLASFDAEATGDFDQDGTVETNGREVAGLLDAEVTMTVVKREAGGAAIESINGLAVG